jgi:hypothetical protein
MRQRKEISHESLIISLEQDVLAILLVTRTSPKRWSVEISGKGLSVPASGNTVSFQHHRFRGWNNENTEK